MEKIRCLSLFSNVGIAETYFEEIGIEVILANEIDEDRAKFYKHLYPSTEMIVGDITDSRVRDEIVSKAIRNNVDFIMATPPCQGMSEAGLRLKDDPRNQLIYYAIDVIQKVRPKFVLLENVPKQLVTKISYDGKKMLIPNYIKQALSKNYRFNNEVLVRAKDHGVPQLRERNIFLLVRNDLDFDWEFPEKEKEITLFEAIGNLPSLDPLLREGEKFTITKFPDFLSKKKAGLKVSKWHYPPKHSWKQVEWMMHTPTGKSAIYNEHYYPQKEGGVPVKAHHNNYRRLKWDMPCRTITQNSGVISSLATVHPGREYIDSTGETLYSDPRVLSIYELLIVSSLPLDWNIPDWVNDTMVRRVIGEGIPPLLVKKIMQVLIRQINREE